MKRTPILLTDAADQDLDIAATYIAGSQDPETAARFLKAVDEIFDLLARHPRIGRVVPSVSRLIPEMRIMQIKTFPNYLACYRITKRGVEIMRVVHGARDYQRLFEE